MDLRSDDRLHGGSQQLILSREAQGARVSEGGIYDRYVLLRRWENHPPALLNH